MNHHLAIRMGALAQELVRLTRPLNKSGLAFPAMIAGGCPRNIYADLPVKDIDIFCTEEVFPAIKDEFPDFRDCSGTENEEEYEAAQQGGSDINVWKGELEWVGETWDADIIICKNPHTQLEVFPDNISKMWIHPRNGIQRQISAIQAFESMHIQCTKDCPDKRYARLKDLFLPKGFKVTREESPQLTIETAPRSKHEARRAKDEAYAPFWWELPPIGPDKAMEAVRALCKG